MNIKLRNIKLSVAAIVLVISIFFIPNNKIVIKNNNGVKTYYKGKKLFSGDMEIKKHTDSGKDIVIGVIHLEKGVPAGSFKFFDKEKNVVVEGDGTWDGDMFTGVIKQHISPRKKIVGTLEGTVKLREQLLNYGDTYNDPSELVNHDDFISGSADKFIFNEFIITPNIYEEN